MKRVLGQIGIGLFVALCIAEIVMFAAGIMR